MPVPKSMVQKYAGKKVKVTCKNCGSISVRKFQYRFRCNICGFNTNAHDAKVEPVEDKQEQGKGS